VEATERVGALDQWWQAFCVGAIGNAVTLAGFDFPIGLPQTYANRAGVESFMGLLPHLGKGEWSDFFEVATTKDEITLRRPFYPHAPGGKRQADLLTGLGVATIDDLRRVCERKTASRQAACSLFWTLGANQVGKAAIAGWRDLFLPLLAEHRPVRFWPFEGMLDELLTEPGLIIAETYPAEFYLHLGLRLTTKRSQDGRRACAQAIFDWATVATVELSSAFKDEVMDGYGPQSDGEDPFDAAVGLCGMLNVVLGRRHVGRHPEPKSEAVEGWIMGQSDEAISVVGTPHRTGTERNVTAQGHVLSAEAGHWHVTPYIFHLWGGDYLAAAKAYRPNARQGSPVTAFLSCQSIELSLKAFLTLKGLNRDKLKGKFGHNLTKLAATAHEYGLAEFVQISGDDGKLLIAATDWYDKNKRLQYAVIGDVGTGLKYPDDEALEALASRLQCDELRQTVFKSA
jgi:hypothetical protein